MTRDQRTFRAIWNRAKTVAQVADQLGISVNAARIKKHRLAKAGVQFRRIKAGPKGAR